METVKQPITTETEMQAILTGAMQISQQYGLKEICTEAVLYAILNNDNLNANTQLLKMGFNVYMLRRVIAERLKNKAIVNPPIEPPYSNALEGLLFLNAFDKGSQNTSTHFLKTIIKNNNTAAARLLKLERVSLTPNNELIYKPIIN